MEHFVVELSILHYPAYRKYMRQTYGPGPWQPDRIEEQDRWQRWLRRKREQAA